jgi:hypothetical protein
MWEVCCIQCIVKHVGGLLHPVHWLQPFEQGLGLRSGLGVYARPLASGILPVTLCNHARFHIAAVKTESCWARVSVTQQSINGST